MGYNYCYACRISIENNINSNNEIILCNDCKEDSFILISKTNAKKKFCLNDHDIAHLSKNTIINKHGRKTTYFYYDDVINKAHKKYGGVSGLIWAREKRLKRGARIKNINALKLADKHNMIQCRRNLILSELEKMGLIYYEDITEFYNYVYMGDNSGYNFENIISIFKEYNFIYSKTDHKQLLNNGKSKKRCC
ncbi:hypothetical protein Catovirus_2_247 [Catovirus CTV1]|uniref:Uncharacterized protein n=1 Tax=Catovirus CTV1 TaxID=1977631 RepID=A0A1V0SCB1_9VIRU|nr:hypothetical protein Catovirus_2_247 [Catovirus CTV1]